MHFQCLADCPPSLVALVAYCLGAGGAGLLAARWRPWSLVVSIPAIVAGYIALFGAPWRNAWVEIALKGFSLILPALGALSRRWARTRGRRVPER